MGTDLDIFCLVGSTAGKAVRAVVSSGDLSIGRSKECGLVVTDDQVSREHCVVRLQGADVVVEDRSRNGTFVNGGRVSGLQTLKVGDVLKLGVTELTLRRESAADQTVVATPEVAAAAAPASDAVSVLTPTVLQPGDMVDRYRIRRLIGKGGMGTVYEVVHTGLDLTRALKALTLPDDPTYASFRDKFLDEGKMLARLKHDNITQVYDAAYDEKTRTLFFVMDLVLYDDGHPCTLADVAYDECDVSAWFASLASALDYIHAQGIVHSDIKLQNVLVSSGQKIKLADFGVAHLLAGKMRSSLRGEDAGAPETIGYTAHYVAPEVLKPGGLPSVASDVYALGVLLVRLLTNRWYDECPTALAEIAAKRSLNWRPILAQMLCADPKMRPTNLTKLVTQLRRGSKALVRRQYVMENRRRRSQQVRLVRMQTGKTSGFRTETFVPEPQRGGKIVRWAIAAAVAVAAVIGIVSMNRKSAAARAAEEAREEELREARASVIVPLQKARVAMDALANQYPGETGRHLREYASVEALSYANVTGTTDKAMASLRNDALVRYADVLKAIGSFQEAAQKCRTLCGPFAGRVEDCERVDAVKEIAAELKEQRQALEAAFDASRENERRKWSAYEAAKALYENESGSRAAFQEGRSRQIAAVRQLLETEAELKATPERTQAAEKVAEGDRFATAVPADAAAALRCYADAVTILSNGCQRLRNEHAEQAAIADGFKRADEELQTTLIPGFRHGRTSLSATARHVMDLHDRFSARWKVESVSPTNRALAAECTFALQAPADYFAYLTRAVPGRRDGLTYKLIPNGVEVNNGRFPYPLGWNDIFSSKKLDMKSKERYRRLILDRFDVPPGKKVTARLLLGRWIVLKLLKPDFNTAEEADRLAEAVRQDGSDEALKLARREIPDKFTVAPPPAGAVPAESASSEANQTESVESTVSETAAEDGAETNRTESTEAAVSETEGETAEAEPQDEFADFPLTLPAAPEDPNQERVIFFAPLQGLNVSAFGRDGVEIVRCVRIRDSRRVRFELLEGVVFVTGAGSRQPRIDIDEGMSFDAGGFEDELATCRYGLITWIDNALGDGRPLVLVRCQRIAR